MTREKLMTLLRDPNQTGQAVDELNRLIAEYPYFHTGHQLYLKSLHQTDMKKMAMQLKVSALSVRDRDVLYQYINRRIQQVDTPKKEELPPPMPYSQQKPLPSDEKLQKTYEPEEDEPLSTTGIYSEKQLEAILSKGAQKKIGSAQQKDAKEGASEEDETNKKDPAWTSSELIDFFLKTNPKIVPKDSQYEVDMSGSLQENNEIATETLADIYASQGHKNKAIEIYEQLILKYPQKYRYFAAQIERLKNS